MHARLVPVAVAALLLLVGCTPPKVEGAPDASVNDSGIVEMTDASVPDGSTAWAFEEVARFEGEPFTLRNRSADLVLGRDVNGDGVPDLLYGNPDQPDSPADAGAPTQGAVVILSGTDLHQLSRIRHSDYATRGIFGYSVASLGDLNGDGLQDLAVTQIATITPALTYEFTGRIYLLTSTPTGFSEQIVQGDDAFHFFGYELIYVGGPNHLLIASAARFFGGRAYGINAQTGARVWTSASSAFDKDLANERRGYRMFDIGDLDGDGIHDVGLSANGQEAVASIPRPTNPEILNLATWPGRQYYYSGATGALLGILQGQPGDNLGFWGSELGDLDADGVHDFVACGGWQSFAGRCYVISGALLRSARAKTQVLDLAVETASIIRTHEGIVATDHYDLIGYRNGALPDLDADGVDDYLLTSPNWVTGTNDAGVVYGGQVRIISGKTGLTLQTFSGRSDTRDQLGGTAAFNPVTKTLYVASQQGNRELVVAYRAVPKVP